MDDQDQRWSVRRVFMAAIFLLTGSGVALGQTSAGAVHTRLTHGRTIAITDAQGQITTGRVVTVTPAVVSVEKADRRFDVPFSEIVAIDEIDRVRNGALVGLVVGAGLFVTDVVVSRADGIYLNGAGYAVFGTIYGGLGLAAGAGIDALIGGNRRIYLRGTTARINVAPTVRPDRAGAVIGISW
jgi:hypothetical protein